MTQKNGKSNTAGNKAGRQWPSDSRQGQAAGKQGKASGRQGHPAGKRAIALKYDAERGTAPLITAVGKGQVADRIIEVAQESGVAQVEDELQANALSAFDAGARVPKFLYDLVAEVLLFIEDADTQYTR